MAQKTGKTDEFLAKHTTKCLSQLSFDKMRVKLAKYT